MTTSSSHKLEHLAVFLVIQSIAVLVVFALVLTRTWGWTFPLRRPARAVVKEVLRYAAGIQSGSLAASALDPASRFIVAGVAGTSAVAPLDIVKLLRHRQDLLQPELQHAGRQVTGQHGRDGTLEVGEPFGQPLGPVGRLRVLPDGQVEPHQAQLQPRRPVIGVQPRLHGIQRGLQPAGVGTGLQQRAGLQQRGGADPHLVGRVVGSHLPRDRLVGQLGRAVADLVPVGGAGEVVDQGGHVVRLQHPGCHRRNCAGVTRGAYCRSVRRGISTGCGGKGVRCRAGRIC